MTVVAGELIAGIRDEAKTRKVAVVIVDQFPKQDALTNPLINRQLQVLGLARELTLPAILVEFPPQRGLDTHLEPRLMAFFDNPSRIFKASFNSFNGTDLHRSLQASGVRSIVLMGGGANQCIRLTAVGGPQARQPGVTDLSRPPYADLTGVLAPAPRAAPSAPAAPPPSSSTTARRRALPLPPVPGQTQPSQSRPLLTQDDIMHRAVRPLALSREELAARGIRPLPFTPDEFQRMEFITITNEDQDIVDLLPDASISGATQHGYRVLTCDAVLDLGPAGTWKNSPGVQFYPEFSSGNP